MSAISSNGFQMAPLTDTPQIVLRVTKFNLPVMNVLSEAIDIFAGEKLANDLLIFLKQWAVESNIMFIPSSFSNAVGFKHLGTLVIGKDWAHEFKRMKPNYRITIVD